MNTLLDKIALAALTLGSTQVAIAKTALCLQRLPMRLAKIILVFASLALLTESIAGNGQVISEAPLTLIHAGRLFDSEQGVFHPARDIIVKGNLIEEVGVNLPAPKDARVVDLRSYTILPGLIDAHTHLLYLE